MRKRLIRLLAITSAIALFSGGCKEQERSATAESPPPSAATGSTIKFVEITEEVGLDFVHETGASGMYYMPESMASGGAFLDFDRDGDLDIYLINGHKSLPDTGPVSAPVNRLYRREANGSYIDVTRESGLGDGGYGMGVAIGDIDNDGYDDVYVTNYGLDRLYRNRGDGTFEDVTESAGIHVDFWSCSAAFVDYDRDGFLDLYVTRYVEYDPNNTCLDGAGRADYCTPMGRPPVPDVLLHNNADGTFNDVSERSGIAGVSAAGLGVVCDDFSGDGWQDIYVANDKYANHLWINQHDGTFRDRALLTGTAYNREGIAEAGMGIVADDLNNDLRIDLFVTHFRNETNTLYRNLGDRIGFGDVTATSGFGSTSIAFTGFGTDAVDAELDGDLDLIVGNGAVVRGKVDPKSDAPPLLAPYAEPNLFYVNDGSGRFQLISLGAGTFTGRVEVSRGLPTGDIDNDGDRDFLVCNMQGPARLYRNDTPDQGHWLGVRAIDPRLNRDAIGARVMIEFGGRQLAATIRSAGGYLSARDPRVQFGLGAADKIDRIIVRWPDGAQERFDTAHIDRYVTLNRGAGRDTP